MQFRIGDIYFCIQIMFFESIKNNKINNKSNPNTNFILKNSTKDYERKAVYD